MPDDPTSQRTTVTLPRELFWQLQAEMARRRLLTTNEAYAEAIRTWLRSDPEASSENEAARAVAHARQILEAVESFRNPYQQLVTSWRLTRTGRQIQAVKSYKLDLDAWPADVYLTKILSELMSELNDADEYCTVTNLRFWLRADENTSAVDHPFLMAQENAVSRGLRIHRVFILAERELAILQNRAVPTSDEERTAATLLRLEMQRHYAFWRRSEERYPGRVRLSCLQTRDLKIALARFGHFAFLRRWQHWTAETRPDRQDQGCMVVEPHYDATGTITFLKFGFSRGSGTDDTETNHNISRFVQAASLATEITAGFIPEDEGAGPAL